MAGIVPTKEFGRNSAMPETASALIETSPFGAGGEVSNPVRGGKGRGGARNISCRESFSLSLSQVTNLVQAAHFALAIDLPLTRFTTIHWEGAGVPLSEMAKATGRYIDLMTKALARHGSRTAWLWTHENGHGKGGHCHLLFHVPPKMVPVISRLQRRWLRSITGCPYRARQIHSKPIGGRLGVETGNPDLYAANFTAVLAYIVKGADLITASQFGLSRLEPGGRVVGKRCGTSQNIGLKARRDHRFCLSVELKLQTAPNPAEHTTIANCGS